jgi:catechol 2,3-dioxygenase-like lactoylglutathione lyase family enzyme
MSLPSPALAFSHVGLYVHNAARMEDFYVRFMGFTVTDRGELPGPHGPVQLVFLSRNPDEHHQLVLVTGRPESIAFNVVNQLSLRADGLATLKAVYAALADEGVSDVMPVTHGNAVSVYFRDPEGNRLEVFVDTPWYVNQPVRVPIDLGLPDAALWQWAEQHARGLPGFRPRAEWRAEMARRMGLA